MGREIRRVPKNWQHPKDERGRYRALYNGSYEKAAEKYWHEAILWQAGAHPDQVNNWGAGCRYYSEYAGRPPKQDDYMFESERTDLTHYMLYETTSEGTPCHDCPFASIDELLDWAAENATTFAGRKARREDWARMLEQGSVYHQVGNIVFC